MAGMGRADERRRSKYRVGELKKVGLKRPMHVIKGRPGAGEAHCPPRGAKPPRVLPSCLLGRRRFSRDETLSTPKF